MSDINDLCIVNYCHPNCIPLKNIMRLPKEQAFALAYEMADKNKNTTAFYRFADFENYYYKRLETDRLLYNEFIKIGAKPANKHPLSFVLQGSEYLYDWFDRGIITKIPLKEIPSEHISFTYGDSMSSLRKYGKIVMLTKNMLLKAISDFNGNSEEFISAVNNKYTYIEVPLWNDDICKFAVQITK